MDDNTEIKLKLLELRNKQDHVYYLICSGLAAVAVFLCDKYDKFIANVGSYTKINSIVLVTLLFVFMSLFLIRLWAEGRIKYDVLLSKYSISQEDLSLLNTKDLILNVVTLVVFCSTVTWILTIIYGVLKFISELYKTNSQNQPTQEVIDSIFRYAWSNESFCLLYLIVILLAFGGVVYFRKRIINKLYAKYENFLYHRRESENYNGGDVITTCYIVKVQDCDDVVRIYNVEITKNMKSNVPQNR